MILAVYSFVGVRSPVFDVSAHIHFYVLNSVDVRLCMNISFCDSVYILCTCESSLAFTMKVLDGCMDLGQSSNFDYKDYE